MPSSVSIRPVPTRRSATRQRTASLLRVVALIALPWIGSPSAPAQVFSDSFTGASAALPWQVYGGACLTAGDNTGSIPACAAGSQGGQTGNVPDVAGQGALRLTQAKASQVGAIFLQSTFASTAGVSVQFTEYAYGGNGADGISFFLLDGSAAIPTKPGSVGGGLGYEAIANGYVGVGIDEYGNFSVPGCASAGVCAGGPGFSPNAIVVRGPSPNNTFLTSFKTGATLWNSVSTRAAATPHTYVLTLTSSGILSVYRDGQPHISGYNAFAAAGTPPATLRLGFSSSTGGSNNVHEISLLQLTSGLTVPALTVAKTASAATLYAGITGQTYQITLTNGGGAATSGPITLTDALPSGITLAGPPTLSGPGSAGATLSGCNTTGATSLGASCSIVGAAIPATAPNNTLTVTIPVAVAASAVGATGGTNTASVTGGGDPACVASNPCSGTTTAVAVALPPADLSITKTAAANGPANGALTYTLTVSNAGPYAANGALLKDPPVSNFTATAVTCTAATGGAVCPGSAATTVSLLQGSGVVLPTLPNGGGLTFQVSGTAGASGSIANVATVAVPVTATDPNPANNSATANTGIVAPAADSGSATAGTANPAAVANVAANDAINGQPATLGTTGNATVAVSGTWPAGITLNPTSGAIATGSAVPPGTYTLTYTLCDRNAPPVCATANATVSVAAHVVPQPDSGTAVAGLASTPIVNVAANDAVNGQPATLGAAGNATVAQSGAWPSGLALNASTGAVTVSALVAPGTYTVSYALCDKSLPTPNCATTNATVTVGASIVPQPDAGNAPAGMAATPVANVTANDTVNGQPATLGAAGNATVSQSGSWPSGIALNPTTGAVTTSATVPPGTYPVSYTLCDRNAPPNCAPATITVTVSATIVPVADTGTVVAGTAATAISNVAANDFVNGQPATLGAGGNATVAQSGSWPAGIVLNPSTGAVTTSSAVPPGTYTVSYTLCDRSTPTPNCATVADTVTVTAAVQPVADSGSAVAGLASTPISNVAANDTVNGQPATLGTSGNATVATSGSWPGGITLNTATGAVSASAQVAPGTYTLPYTLCDRHAPPNCATVSNTVTVTANIVPVTDTGAASAGVASSAIVNVAANDSVNGQPATLGPSGNATVAQSGNWPAGLALNSTTGAVTVSATVPPGTYTLTYTLCDRSSPTANCKSVDDTVTVTASVVPAPDSGQAPAGSASTPVANVALNDSVNGQPATLGPSGNATVAPSGNWPAGLALNTATGAVTAAAGLATGTYGVPYTLCDRSVPTAHCATATVTITVTASVVPGADSGSATAGTAGTPVPTVLHNDTINGQPATLGPAGNATVAEIGSWPAGIALNTSTGAVTTATGVAPGSYALVYALCDRSTPAHCANATLNLTVLPPGATATSLRVAKFATPSEAAIGDTVRYTVLVQNTAASGAVQGVTVRDVLPTGFSYVRGTARLAGTPAVPMSGEPAGAPGPTLLFPLGVVPAGGRVSFTYYARLGATAADGDGINRATAVTGAAQSNTAEAQVTVRGGVFDTRACLIGKVYTDCGTPRADGGPAPGDGLQGTGEVGIPGVRFYLEDGSYVVSDSEGKYSLCGLTPRTHTMVVDPTTLPSGARLGVTSNRNAGDAYSLFVDVKNGELHRTDFREQSCSTTVLDEVRRRRSAMPAGGAEDINRASATGPGHALVRPGADAGKVLPSPGDAP